jgi:hypothetical protein
VRVNHNGNIESLGFYIMLVPPHSAYKIYFFSYGMIVSLLYPQNRKLLRVSFPGAGPGVFKELRSIFEINGDLFSQAQHFFKAFSYVGVLSQEECSQKPSFYNFTA